MSKSNNDYAKNMGVSSGAASGANYLQRAGAKATAAYRKKKTRADILQNGKLKKK